MKLPEFLQTAYRKVIEWFLRPVLAVRIVEPPDQVENPFIVPAAALPRRQDFFYIVFLALLDVVCFPEYLRRVWWCSVFAGSVGFEQRDIEDVVNLPFPRQHEADGKRVDDSFDLKGTMILVIQVLCGVTRFDVVAVKYYQVSYLICRRFFPGCVSISSYSFLHCFQPLPGFLVYRLHPVSVYCAGWIQWFCCGRVEGYRVEAVVCLERCYSVTRRDRVVVGKFCHR